MKRIIILLILIISILTACINSSEVLLYHQLPKDYTLEEAKADGCVVYEDLDITSGQPVWDKFIILFFIAWN
ncbi:hypothetical protein [Sinanaerobacter chloroacetimidivorans]|jgi:hypothetical protein|uniref:Lipoprotein n=1 Tax=Sinanaerobacter chloroacetimidivorans TaxID=2818044 RepID=A0A8J7W4Z0_9FIRM|nr:hypothetical protein [Sinanaerobacter chloroacetimidivorans]MBR0600396.1 hypothetical protein [Sinanaerobacter chloroacetimidivorans]